MITGNYIKLNNKTLNNKLEKYVLNNPCCSYSPKCVHPNFQSDANVFDLKDKEIVKIKNYYFDLIKYYFNKKDKDFDKTIAWVFLTKKNNLIKENWHKHSTNDNQKGVSGLMYLTDTTHGTFFKTDFYELKLIPKKNTWFIWESNTLHTPVKGVESKDRLVLATSTIFKNENL
jgi:hypothetical protein